jgi:hypothetical protein
VLTLRMDNQLPHSRIAVEESDENLGAAGVSRLSFGRHSRIYSHAPTLSEAESYPKIDVLDPQWPTMVDGIVVCGSSNR